MTEVVIFAPSPVLTVTVEDHPDGPEVHLHAGGQGVWQARMLLRLGVDVTMVSVLTGESGRMLRHLLGDEGIRVVAVERTGRGAAYVHDRRGGERVRIVETGGEPISRHDLDELYGHMLGEGLGADLVILNFGHNGGDDTAAQDAALSGLLEKVLKQSPNAVVVGTAQNPEKGDQNKAKREAVKAWDDTHGLPTIDVNAAFVADGRGDKLRRDDVHPNDDGSQVWEAAVVKVLGTGELTVALDVKVDAWSKSAKEKIEKAGGSVSER